MTSLATPREVLREMRQAKRKPWWADKLADRIEAHLTKTQWQGKPLIDQRLSEKACQAVIDEALNVVRLPDPSDPIGEMLYDMKAAGHA